MTNFYLIWFIATKLIFWSPFLVEGQSMEPTLHDRELFVIDKQVFRDGELQRGDIVVFSFGDDYYYVKRVIGLPGETVRIGGSTVEIKQPGGEYQTLVEPYLTGETVKYGDERFFIVPENEYFVLGDNRAHSKDSRSFSYPYVRAEQIYGKYLWPSGEID
ncbi:signal peptidase I [Candidatus Peregrinibacteria bacterium]|nr:signal peptidase I [Candidatus Peregrinibacteria bacterium]